MPDLIESKQHNWLADLAFEYALGYYTPEELQLKYDIDDRRFHALAASKVFKQAVNAFRRQIDEEGEQFRIKARRMASEVLDVLFDIAGNPESSSKDRIAAVDSLCRYAGFDKKDEEKGAGQITIQIANYSETSA